MTKLIKMKMKITLIVMMINIRISFIMYFMTSYPTGILIANVYLLHKENAT